MNPKPYETCIEYVEDELMRYLPARASRISYERRVQDLSRPFTDNKTIGDKQPVSMKEAERQAQQYRKQETRIRTEIDARLDATRQVDGNEPGFSLDLLNGGLDFDARLILLTLTSTALGMGDQSLGNLGTSFYGSAHVDDLMAMMDVKTISDRLRVRRLLLDLTGMGLIVLDYNSKAITPEDFNTAQVSLSRRTFAVILDDPSLETEGVTSKQSH